MSNIDVNKNDSDNQKILTTEERIRIVKEKRKKDGYKVTFEYSNDGRTFEDVLIGIIRSHM